MSPNSSPNHDATQWDSISEAILRSLELERYLGVPPLKLTMITDKMDQAQATDLMRRTTLAHGQFMERKPAVIRPRPIEQRFVDVEAIHRSVIIERETAENAGLSLLVLLCKTNPVDLVVGIGAQGEGVVADLHREAPRLYPEQAQKFVTQTELEQAARERFFAGEPDAFLLVAIERLYKAKIIAPSSGS